MSEVPGTYLKCDTICLNQFVMALVNPQKHMTELHMKAGCDYILSTFPPNDRSQLPGLFSSSLM